MKRGLRGALLIVAALALTACSGATILTRSDMPLQGMKHQATYRLVGTPDGSSEINEITLAGMGEESPMTEAKTTFVKTNDTLRQQVTQVFVDGRPVNALAMSQAKTSFGLTGWLTVSTSSYDMRDAAGKRACGFKIRMNFSPNGVQFISEPGPNKGWDALWYYTDPCDQKQPDKLDIAGAKLHALVINEQYVMRLTSDPLFFNRGRSVTIVGGKPAQLTPGWWLHNIQKGAQPGVLEVANLVKGMVNDLYTSPGKWQSFSPNGPYADSTVMYAAGDADVFWSVDRQVLNRQTDYHVFVRPSINAPLRHLVIHPIYNFEWNDWSQNVQAYKDLFGVSLSDRINKDTGAPNDANDAVVKEIEKEGWMNSPNPSLEQIQILDGDTQRILYAMTVRGYIGAKNSLVMFGQPPGSLQALLQKYGNNTPYEELKKQGQGCPIKYDDLGKPLPPDQQISDADCARLLREGPMWQYLTEHPDEFGFDLVSQMNIKNDGKWASHCTGSGDSTYCYLVPVENNMNASYMFSTAKTEKAWTVMQLLGEVGVRTLGMSYTSGPYDGTGMLFAMGQPIVRHQYLEGISDPEMVFALDARALQLPDTMSAALGYLGVK